jgi:flagellar basal-body rod protein FlgC
MAISATGMRAKRMTMDTIANNIANQDVIGDTKQEFVVPYRRREVILAPDEGMDGRSMNGVRVLEIANDPTPFELEHRPGHPLADEKGMILRSNVNPMLEMADMVSATRAYEANIQAFDTARSMFETSLQILG